MEHARVPRVALALTAAAVLLFGSLSPATAPAAAFDPLPPCTATIAGTVTTTAGKPVRGVEVEVGEVWDIQRRAKTGKDGRYAFTRMCPGDDYKITAGRRAPWFLPRSTVLTPGRGKAIRNFALTSAAQLRITVKNATKFRSPGITIINARTGKKVTQDVWHLSSTVRKLPAGTYKIKASGSYKKRMKFSGPTTRTVKAKPGKRAHAAFAIDKGGIISGRVKTSRHWTHCERYGVVSVRNERGFFAAAYVSKNGSYSLKGLPAGTYKVHLAVPRGNWNSSADFYRAGTSRIKTVSVKTGKRTKLATVSLRPKYIGRWTSDAYLWLNPRCLGEG